MFRIFDYLRGVEVVRKDTQSSLSEKLFRLNRKFFKHVLKLLSIMFPKILCLSTLLFISLLIIVISLELIIYNVGLISGKYYKVLSDKNLVEFRNLTIVSILMIVANALIKSLSDYIATILRIVWRKNLTLYLNENYFRNKKFYYLQIQTKKIYENSSLSQTTELPFTVSVPVSVQNETRLLDNSDRQAGINRNNNSYVTLDNPDQRITQDVDNMCASIAKIAPLLLITPFIIGFQKAGYTGPLAVFIYFVIGGILNGPLMSPIAGVVYLQDKLEGNFRYKHMSIRTHAESVAFYNSGNNELLQTNKIFNDLISISFRRNWKEFLLKLLVNILQYLGAILSYLILAIPIFTHLYDNLTPAELAQLISTYSFLCNYLVYLFTRLYDLSNEISIIAGNAHRVGQLVDAITSQNSDVNNTNQAFPIDQESRNLNETDQTNETSRPLSPVVEKDVCLIADNLTITTPDKRKLLIKNFNFKFQENVNVLITGRSGCGKTSLFRVFSGLWKSYTGNLYLTFDEFDPSSIFFLPQTPYFTNGSLIEQIVYPTSVSELRNIRETTELIMEWLKKFNLEHILDKINNNMNLQPNFHWPTILSQGEQQRLSFFRVLYHKPKYALLDEFTSSVDQETESLMYETLREIHITYLSIAHRDTVRKYHDFELKILNNGNYTLEPISSNDVTTF